MYSDTHPMQGMMVSLDYHDNLHFSVSDCKRHGCEYAAAKGETSSVPLIFLGVRFGSPGGVMLINQTDKSGW